ncbi:hypothetical protein AGLY_012479 [Aphis glycines]|uniref:Uncharacterized protein n=1 Tax=Aphis glycines TaxID=307491 RepID=A0A6G0TCE0_APHGL|nr:hypothetical protein AGLY_012479 [Aphis glycines]
MPECRVNVCFISTACQFANLYVSNTIFKSIFDFVCWKMGIIARSEEGPFSIRFELTYVHYHIVMWGLSSKDYTVWCSGVVLTCSAAYTRRGEALPNERDKCDKGMDSRTKHHVLTVSAVLYTSLVLWAKRRCGRISSGCGLSYKFDLVGSVTGRAVPLPLTNYIKLKFKIISKLQYNTEMNISNYHYQSFCPSMSDKHQCFIIK